jgi:hypothetical protein
VRSNFVYFTQGNGELRIRDIKINQLTLRATHLSGDSADMNVDIIELRAWVYAAALYMHDLSPWNYTEFVPELKFNSSRKYTPARNSCHVKRFKCKVSFPLSGRIKLFKRGNTIFTSPEEGSLKAI